MTLPFFGHSSPPVSWRALLLFGLIVLALGGVALLEPIPQDPAYHRFADQRTLLGIPNALDVLSNLPFLLVGVCGLRQLLTGPPGIDTELRPCGLIFFVGVGLTAFGSGYYHFVPDNASLVWDRLPMTLAFMSLVSLVVGEHVSLRLGRSLLWPLLATGVASVIWWASTESAGAGDLRPYALVQFLPLLLLPLIMLLYRPRWTKSGFLWLVGGCYLLAKLLEFMDGPVFALVGLSGHTLKHLAAAVGAWCLLHMLRVRERHPQR